MYERQIVVNELAQGLRPVAEGMAWFAGCPEAEQRLVVRELVHFCIQAHATAEDAQEAITRSGLRPTYTPAVMLIHWRLHMSALPPYDLPRAFRLLIALLAIADARRRERYCVGGCGHEWHQLARSTGAGPAAT
ncbi:DUF5958 family protein [Streptomyces angustmyceticus]|uniref:DUF5958 family protein n=1 Tax=Streptomyces angustmyceticus TaxID=285578 RepID=UPI0021AF14FF|nr:DUF5958 family protein [Streptomyces angustmyceticus]